MLIYKESYDDHTFHDSFYFIIVTLMTVGYGDINPTTELGQVMSIMVIGATIVIVPQQTTELLRLISMQSKYRRIDYKGADVQHVVVTGYIGINAIKNFCEELFHDDHGQLSAHAVLI